MTNLTLSINGLYLLNEEKIYFVKEAKSYDLNDLTFLQWIDIYKENTSFAIRNSLLEIKDLYSFNRKMVYQLSEAYSYEHRTKILMEYEHKFSNNLLTENVILLENWFTDAWDWMKNKFQELGGWAVTLGKNLAICVSGSGCSPFFEQFRELLFNPVSVGVQVFLSTAFPGAGNLGMGLVWGIMAMYDGYLLATGDPQFSWMNLIIDILGVVFAGIGLAATARAAVGGSKGVAMMAGKSLDDVVSSLAKNPKTGSILKSLGQGARTILSKLKPIGNFMTNKMGLKWIGKAFSAIENAVSNLITKISPKTSQQIATASGKGVRAGVEFAAIGGAIHGVGKLAGGGESMEKAIIDANKKIKPNYSQVRW